MASYRESWFCQAAVNLSIYRLVGGPWGLWQIQSNWYYCLLYVARFPSQGLKLIARFEGSALKATPEKSAQDRENLDGHGKLKITESPSQVSKCYVFFFSSGRVLIQESEPQNLWQKNVENDQRSVETSLKSLPMFWKVSNRVRDELINFKRI